MPRYRTVVLDVDSTLVSIEGIDWLAVRRGAQVARDVEQLTTAAMDGQIGLHEVYARRLALVAPSATDLAALGDAYVAALLPGAADAVAAMQTAGVRVVLLSGGLRPSVEVLATALGVPHADVHAADLDLHPDGTYAGVDVTQPLATPMGKAQVLRVLGLPRPLLMVGDGATDAEARAEADAFCAFTGVVARDRVVRRADQVAADFATVLALVLPA
jgi:HAD superfamily phosphoserine phosphatase-like hydrolase